MRLEKNNRQEAGRRKESSDREESDFTLLSLVPGAGLLVRFWFWILLQWRALRIQCARAWFHFGRGRATRRERDRQHRSTGVIAASSRKVKAAPVAVYENYRHNRAWLFTTVCGTIGIILLIFLFLRSWWETEKTEEITGPPEMALGEPSQEPLLFITDYGSGTGESEVRIDIQPFSIIHPPLTEEYVIQSPRLNWPEYYSNEGDTWVAYRERPAFTPALANTEGPSLNFEEFRPSVKYDPPEEEPAFSFEIPDQPAEPLEPEPEPELVEKITIKKVYPRGTPPGEKPDTFTILVINEGETYLDQRMIQEEIPAGYQLVQPDRFTHLAQGTLFWTVQDLAPGDRREIQLERIQVQPEPVPEINLAREPKPQKPHLQVKVDQPQQVHEGEIVPIQFRVRNAGESRVTNVVLATELPAELDYPRGRQLKLKIPALDPGESRSYRLTTKAVQTGKGIQKTNLSGTDFSLAIDSRIQVVKAVSRQNKPAPRRVTAPPQEQPTYYVHPMPWHPPCCRP
ncbi:MAG: hypothetical protein KDA65_09540, partial [Planctomycetaceae bacterium]|nr:hypothetical protein [Planctomycetaceae bacterium]